MKSFYVILGFLLCSFTVLNAQIDVKVNPIGLIFNSPDVSVEYGVTNNFGVEGVVSVDYGSYKISDVEYKNSGFGARLNGKYYFSPNRGLDKWYVGAYGRFKSGKAKTTATNSTSSNTSDVKSKRITGGMLFGYKYVSAGNFVLEVFTGVGRNFVSNYEYSDGSNADLSNIPLANLHVPIGISLGYRFGAKNN